MMQAQMTVKQWWYEVDGPEGTEWVQEADCGYLTLDSRETNPQAFPPAILPYLENTCGTCTITRVYGYGVRSSMPGYLDCTPWTVYHNLREAQKAYRAEVHACRGED